MKDAVPFAIHTFSAKPHAKGYAFMSESGRSHFVPGRQSDADNPNGEVRWLVRNGKALNSKGRELLRKPN